MPQVHAPAFVGALVFAALMCGPPGGVVVAMLLPRLEGRAVRLALTIGTGYLLTPALLNVLGSLHLLGWYVPICLALLLVWLRIEWARRATLAERPPGGATLDVAVIAGLSLFAVSPLMAPFHQIDADRFVSYAYIDNYFHLALVDSLTRSIPLSDWPNMAGSIPEFYPVYHHIFQAMLSRLTGADPADVFFVYGPTVLVVLTIALSYAVGAAMTRSRWGGCLAGSLQYLVVLPNVYDRNALLVARDVPLVPNFYQLRFYAARYAAHSASGDIALLLVILAFIVALDARDHRARAGALTLMCLAAVSLVQLRPQFALAVFPASAIAVAGFWWQDRRPLYLVPPCVALVFMLATLPHRMFASPGTSVTLEYGQFGNQILHGYLPVLTVRAIDLLPALLRPGVGVAVYLLLRLIGLNYLLLFAWSATRRSVSTRLWIINLYLTAVIAFAFLASLFLEQSDAIGNIGVNVLLVSRVPVTLLVAPMLLDLGRLVSARYAWIADHRRLLAGAAVVLLALVSHRAANAVLHDRMDRAYPVTAAELASYQWVRQHTPPGTVIAAEPAHVVNARGERIRDTNVLSGLTGRPVYLQRITPFIRREGERRAGELESLFESSSSVDACKVALNRTFEYVLEYESKPFAAGPLPCLTRVFAGNPNVYRVERGGS